MRRYGLSNLPMVDDSRLPSGARDMADIEAVEYEWAQASAKHVGTVIHQVLQFFTQQSDREVQPLSTKPLSTRQLIESRLPHIKAALALSGLSSHEQEGAQRRVIEALKRIGQSQRAGWLLAQHHRDACSEYRVSGYIGGEFVNAIIDRTFIDEDGQRWIVDYKTGAHSGGLLAEFLDEEVVRYEPQLNRYAALMQAMDTRPIMLGLYFPVLDAWREWPYVK